MKVLLFLCMIYLLFACNAGTVSKNNREFNRLTTDSQLLRNLSKKTKALNLPTIYNGVDSFELRIWHGISIVTPNQLVILKYEDSAWQLTNTDYWLSYGWTNGYVDTIHLDSSFTKSLAIPSNISSLVDSIYQVSLDTFPSQSEIPDFQDRVADGFFYEIEVATPNFYKAVRYNNPNRYSDSYNQKISKMITMLSIIGVFSMP